MALFYSQIVNLLPWNTDRINSFENVMGPSEKLVVKAQNFAIILTPPVSSIKITTQPLLFDVGLKNRVDNITLISKGILSTMTEILVCMPVEESMLVSE